MAKREYPQDEFDALKGGVAVGAHRRVPRGWTRLLALVATAAIATGAAYGAVWVLFNRSDIPIVRDVWGGNEAPSESAFVTETPSETATESPSPTVSLSPSPTETVDIRYGVKVRISNDSKIDGLAGKIRDVVEGDGFTKVSIANWSGVSPPGSTIRYEGAKNYETAAYIGRLLGIGSISEGETDGVSIQVILRDDPLPEPSGSATPSATASE